MRCRKAASRVWVPGCNFALDAERRPVIGCRQVFKVLQQYGSDPAATADHPVAPQGHHMHDGRIGGQSLAGAYLVR